MGFWRDTLGLAVEKRGVLPDQRVEVALLGLANSRIELVQPLDPESSVGRFIQGRGEALHHVCFTTGDIDTEMASLRERGIALIDGVARQGIDGRVCFIHPRAHAGVLVELVEAQGLIEPRPERRGIGNAGAPRPEGQGSAVESGAELWSRRDLARIPSAQGLTIGVLDVDAAVAAWSEGIGLPFSSDGALAQAQVDDIAIRLELRTGTATPGLESVGLAGGDSKYASAVWPAYVAQTSVEEERRIRVLIAKPGLDGHDRGARVVARALREAGMDVSYTGIRQTPEAIAEAAAQHQVDVLGVSILSGAHLSLIPRVMEALEAQGVRPEDLLVVAGGIIPDEDIPALRELGVAAVFGPGTKTGDIVAYIRANLGGES
jgi:methylmalonyl-CoA mutase C-terminal domain/subunit